MPSAFQPRLTELDVIRFNNVNGLMPDPAFRLAVHVATGLADAVVPPGSGDKGLTEDFVRTLIAVLAGRVAAGRLYVDENAVVSSALDHVLGLGDLETRALWQTQVEGLAAKLDGSLDAEITACIVSDDHHPIDGLVELAHRAMHGQAEMAA